MAHHLELDIRRARTMLGFEPRYDFRGTVTSALCSQCRTARLTSHLAGHVDTKGLPNLTYMKRLFLFSRRSGGPNEHEQARGWIRWPLAITLASRRQFLRMTGLTMGAAAGRASHHGMHERKCLIVAGRWYG